MKLSNILLLSLIVYLVLQKMCTRFGKYYVNFKIYSAYEHEMYDYVCKNYKCICSRKSLHIPERVLHRTPLRYVCVITRDVGTTFGSLTSEQKRNIHDLDEQLDCIATNHSNMDFYNGDLHSGNFCVDKTGCVHLIDLERCTTHIKWYDKSCIKENLKQNLKNITT